MEDTTQRGRKRVLKEQGQGKDEFRRMGKKVEDLFEYCIFKMDTMKYRLTASYSGK